MHYGFFSLFIPKALHSLIPWQLFAHITIGSKDIMMKISFVITTWVNFPLFVVDELPTIIIAEHIHKLSTDINKFHYFLVVLIKASLTASDRQL